MAKLIFITNELLEKIDRKVTKICQHWDVPSSKRFQVWQMVATVESGLAKKTTVIKGKGILVDGWNGYKDLPDTWSLDPVKAWNGFYRTEPAQMVGWILLLVWREQPADRQQRLEKLRSTHGYQLEWEDGPRVWGYSAWEDFDTQRLAVDTLANLKGAMGGRLKSYSVSYRETTGCWRVSVKATAKTGLRNEHRARVERKN